MHAGKQNRRRSSSGKRLCAAFSTVAIAATTVGIAPASATLGPNPIEPGRNITVFHNIDFVAAFGWPAGEEITVDVIRNGVTIGSATGPSVITPEGPGLEVNHGPEGAPQPGDCWSGHTPDVRPGDTIRVTHGTDLSDVIVDNITFSGDAVEEVVTPGINGDIVVKGVALTAGGDPIGAAGLDSAEFRDGQFRGVPDVVEDDPAVEGGFIMRYHPPYNLERNRDNFNEEQRKASLLTTGGHATGFGHTEVLPPESMLVDGIADIPGPAPGCETLAPGASDAVTTATTTKAGFINAADLDGAGNLVVGGTSFDTSSVAVTIGGLTQTVTPTGATQQSWTANFPKADIALLPDGEQIVSMVATRNGGGTVTGATKTLMKDTEAPAAPTASPGAGPHIGVQNVTLSAGAGDDIFFNRNAAADPTAATGTKFTNPIQIDSTSTLKAIAVDDAMNPSTVLTGEYTITPQTAPGVPTPGATRAGDRSATLAWSAPTSDGFSSISGYEVTADASGSVLDKSMTVFGDARTATVGGLENGTTYQLRVAAINAFGESAQSAPRAVTPAATPDAPEIGFARAGRGTASVTWLAPEDNGANVTSYRLRVYRGPSLVRTMNLGNVRRASLAGLAYGANYRFAVRARNVMGYSSLSPRSNAVVPRSTPSQPRRVRGQSGRIGGRDTARVTWLAPATIRGSRITTYVVRAQRVRANGSLSRFRVVAVKPPRARSANLALRSGTYRFKVRAINGIGRSPWSNLSNRAQSR